MSSKPCRYECGQLLTWDNKQAKYIESDGTLHTPERCKSLKASKPAPATAAKSDGDYSQMHEENMVANRLLVAAINRLAAAIEGKKA